MALDLKSLKEKIEIVEKNLPSLKEIDEKNIIVNEFRNTFNFRVLIDLPKNFPESSVITWFNFLNDALKEHPNSNYINLRDDYIELNLVLDDDVSVIIKDIIRHIEVSIDKSNIRLLEFFKNKYNSEVDRLKNHRDLTLKATTIVKAINAEIKA